MSVPKRRKVRPSADTDKLVKKWERQESRHWPTGGDLTFWQLLKLIFKGEKRGRN